jgi:hypothetical protein
MQLWDDPQVITACKHVISTLWSPREVDLQAGQQHEGYHDQQQRQLATAALLIATATATAGRQPVPHLLVLHPLGV